MNLVDNLPHTSGIYCILNKYSYKYYIGSAINIYARCSVHQSALIHNNHRNIYLQRAWNKYKEHFIIVVLEECDKFKLIEIEQEYIDLFRSHSSKEGYNINPIAQSSLGRKPRLETLLKVSGSNHWTTRKSFSQETKDKMSKARIGKIIPRKVGQNISKSKYKIVLQYDLNDNFIKEWIGATIAEKELKLWKGAISAQIKGILKQTKGFKWKYKIN